MFGEEGQGVLAEVGKAVVKGEDCGPGGGEGPAGEPLGGGVEGGEGEVEAAKQAELGGEAAREHGEGLVAAAAAGQADAVIGEDADLFRHGRSPNEVAGRGQMRIADCGLRR